MKPHKLRQVVLGTVTSIGGFLGIGSLTTSAQAGAVYGYDLVWALALGTVFLVALIEMSGRLAAISGRTLASALREHFGWRYFLVPLVAEILVDFLVIAANLGGLSLVLHYLTGVDIRVAVVPAALLIWLTLWRANFGFIENGASMLGLVTLSFVAAAVLLDPPYGSIAAGLLPSLPEQLPYQYWLLALSIVGATLNTFLLYFYSSGVLEERWTREDILPNRVTAVVGMGFGALVALGVMVVSAEVLRPLGVQVDAFSQIVFTLTAAFPDWGFWLFLAALAVTTYGTLLEVTLESAYVVAQGFGWNWTKNARPARVSRFTLVYTVMIALAMIPIQLGFDPLRITLLAMAASALIIPVFALPMLVIMNDPRYLGRHTNGWLSNAILVVIVLTGSLIAVSAVPLVILGGGG